MSAPFSPLQRFAIGAGLSSVMVLFFFLTSMYATHKSLGDMGSVQVGVAIALPLFCGVIAAIKNDKFLERLANVLENLHL
ncbi:MAG: hypothetical protein AAGD25_10515 [Cyanobacteria bacterium P01_F01_bin.150]